MDKSDAGDGQRKLENEVAPYRQPMITSLGIVLGFMLAFLANWAAQADDMPAVSTGSDWLILITLGTGIALFTLVLYRLLDNTIHTNAGLRYRATLRLYMTGLVISIAGLIVALVI